MQELMPVFKIYRPLPPGPGLPLGFTSYQLLKVLQCDAPNFPILDFSLEEHEQGGCGRASVTASRDLSLNHRDRIDIEILGELRYSGEIKTLPATGNAMTWEYGLVGFIDQLNDVQIQKYEIKWQVARSTVQSLITTHIAPKTDITPDTTQVQDTRSIPGWDSVIENLEFNWATPAEIIEVIRQMCGADWVYGIDARRRLYFRQRTNAAPTRIYSLGEKPLIGYVPERSSKRVKSKLHVEIGKFSNGDPFFMDFENAETRKTYGNREDRASLPAHFPLYGAENLIHTKDAALNSQGMPHIIDLDAIKDEDGMTYMDSGEAMTAGAQLWSKLGSTAEIVTPEVSQLDQDGHPTTGQIIGSPTFGAGKFGNAFQPSNGNYARYPTRANQITIAAGAAEFWWKPATDNPAGIAVFFDFSSPELTKGGILFHYEDRRLVISARVGGQYTASSRSAIQNWVAGTWYHIAVAWDTSANRLGYHAGVNSKTTAMMWINGVAVYRGTKQFSGGETNDYVNIGANLNGAGNTVASYGAIDNIKFYDHPNGRWQGWETEDVRKEAQGIIIQLDKEYPIGMIQVCSEPSDPQVEIGAHYAPGLRVYVGTGPSWPPPNWRLVYDSPSTGPLQEITYTPGIGTRWILIRISRSSTENWRVYGVGAYELKAQDVMQWANAYLAERAEEEISAAAEIERQIAPPTPGEKARVIDLDGHAQDYNIARVAWRAGGQTANLDLGENPRAVAPTLQAI
jgi:hypothetical protein